MSIIFISFVISTIVFFSLLINLLKFTITNFFSNKSFNTFVKKKFIYFLLFVSTSCVIHLCFTLFLKRIESNHAFLGLTSPLHASLDCLILAITTSLLLILVLQLKLIIHISVNNFNKILFFLILLDSLAFKCGFTLFNTF